MQGSSTSQATRTPPSEEKAGTQTVPLESIQNFGSIDTLCSDKTGTLTSGETKLEGFLNLSEQESERVLLVRVFE